MENVGQLESAYDKEFLPPQEETKPAKKKGWLSRRLSSSRS